MKEKEQFAAALRKHLDAIIDDIERIGPRPRGGARGEFKATLVIRHTGNDHATLLFGQDDEAALIAALTTLGASRGRKHYQSNADGLTETEA